MNRLLFDCFRFNDELSMEKELRLVLRYHFILLSICIVCRSSLLLLWLPDQKTLTQCRTGQIPAATLAEAWTLAAQKKLMAQGKAETYTVNYAARVNTVPMFK